MKLGPFIFNLKHFAYAVVPSSLVTTYLVAVSIEKYDQRRVANRFLYGEANLPSSKFVFPRKDLFDITRGLIPGEAWQKPYYTILCGENGTGKSTAVQQFLVDQNLDNGHGVVLVKVQINAADFGRNFADSIGYSVLYKSGPFRNIFALAGVLSHIDKSDNKALTRECWRRALKAADYYNKCTGLIPVIIFDDITHLVETEAGCAILRSLQLQAKLLADEGRLHIVFVTSGDKGLQWLERDSAILRARYVEVGDIPDSDALRLVSMACGGEAWTTLERAALSQTISAAVGGRMHSLVSLVAALKNTKDIVAATKAFEEKLLESATVTAARALTRPALWVLANEINNSPNGHVRVSQSQSGVTSDRDMFFEVRGGTVFSFHQKTRTFAFKSRAIQTAVRKLIIANDQKKKLQWWLWW